VQGQADLFEVVGALEAGHGADILHRWHQQADHDRNDRKGYHQLKQGKAGAPAA